MIRYKYLGNFVEIIEGFYSEIRDNRDNRGKNIYLVSSCSRSSPVLTTIYWCNLLLSSIRYRKENPKDYN